MPSSPGVSLSCPAGVHGADTPDGHRELESVKGRQSLLRSRAADFVEWTDGRAPHGGRSTSDPLGSQPTNCRRIKTAPGFVPVGER